MWYKRNNEGLDYTKPIIARKSGKEHLLIPVAHKSYTVTGYNWFDIKTGTWASALTWETPEEAVQSRLSDYYEVTNTEITLS